MHAADTFAGSWRLSLYPDAGTESHLAFASFMQEGILITSPPPVERFPLTPGGIVHVSAGHGAWETTGRTATLTFCAQATNGEGMVVGLGTVSSRLELAADGQEIAGRYAFEMADGQGTIFATEEGNARFTRIVVRPGTARPSEKATAA